MTPCKHGTVGGCLECHRESIREAKEAMLRKVGELEQENKRVRTDSEKARLSAHTWRERAERAEAMLRLACADLKFDGETIEDVIAELEQKIED